MEVFEASVSNPIEKFLHRLIQIILKSGGKIINLDQKNFQKNSKILGQIIVVFFVCILP